MASYVSIRGWMEIDEERADDVRDAINSYCPADSTLISDDQLALYRLAWHVQHQTVNWSRYCFFGADVRRETVDAIEDWVCAVAEAARGTDGEVAGVFHLDDDDGEESSVWTIGDDGITSS